jgi:hypothetical protein
MIIEPLHQGVKLRFNCRLAVLNFNLPTGFRGQGFRGQYTDFPIAPTTCPSADASDPCRHVKA